MSKRWIPALVLLLSAAWLSGCVGVAPTYTDSGRSISVRAGQEFVIALGSNPTTGYGWQASYDDKVLQLVTKTYQPGDQSQGRVGGGGVELFRFQALSAGEATVTLAYQRPWESVEPVDRKVFTVNIR